MTRRFYLPFLTALLIAGWPLSVQARPGSAWMEIGPGGRAAALGDAMTAAARDPFAGYWNPAAVGLTGNTAAATIADWWVEGMAVHHLAGTFVLGELGVGFDARHAGIGDMELRDGPSASPLGSFDSRNLALGASVSAPLLAGVRLGMSGRFLSETVYVHQANGWSMDAGLLRPGLLGGALDIGFTIRHFGHISALVDEEYDLPTTVSAGAALRPGSYGPVAPTVLFDIAQVRDLDPVARGGLELMMFEALALRGGYAAGEDSRGFSAGFGVVWRQFRVDYGYAPYGDDLGSAQRVTVAAVW